MRKLRGGREGRKNTERHRKEVLRRGAGKVGRKGWRNDETGVVRQRKGP